jgi:fumarylpyruvate hydrolase
MSTAFEPWQPPVLPVVDGPGFPVRRIFCVGRNYAAHAREMGANPDRDLPCFFAKPTDSLHIGDGRIPYPMATVNLHHEVELVVALGPGAEIFGYAVGLDMTRRDLQQAAKDRRWPWALSKGFAGAAPIGPIVRGAEPTGRIWLEVNGNRRQEAELSELIWPVADVLAELSKLTRLYAGDLIFTGTPAGVGAVVPKDRLVAHIDGLPELAIEIAGGTDGATRSVPHSDV